MNILPTKGITYKEWCQLQRELAIKLAQMSPEEAILTGKSASFYYLSYLETRADDMIVDLGAKIQDLTHYAKTNATSIIEQETIKEQVKSFSEIRNRIIDIHDIFEYYIKMRRPADRYATRDVCGNIVETPTRRATWAHTWRR